MVTDKYDWSRNNNEHILSWTRFIPIDCNLRVFQLMSLLESQSQLGNLWERGNSLHSGSVCPSWKKLQIWQAERENNFSVFPSNLKNWQWRTTKALLNITASSSHLNYVQGKLQAQHSSIEQTDWMRSSIISCDVQSSTGRWGQLSITHRSSLLSALTGKFFLFVFLSFHIWECQSEQLEEWFVHIELCRWSSIWGYTSHRTDHTWAFF